MRKIILIIMLSSFTFLQAANVENPDKPLKGEWDLKPEKIWAITNAGNDVLARPNITVSDDGTCYVHDYKKHLTYLFDSTGSFKKAFAKKGEGPGEVVWHLLSYSFGDKLMIADRSKIHYFSKDGKFKERREFKYLGQLPIIFTSENSCITKTHSSEKDEINLLFLKAGTKKIIEKYTLKDKEFEFSSGLGIRMPGVHSEVIIGYDYDNKKMYYGINDSYSIHSSDLDGNKGNSFSVIRERKKIPKDALKKAIKIMAPEAQINEIKNFPNKLTYFNRIEVHNGLVYVFEANLGSYWEMQPIDIFSPNGKYLYRTVFKPGEGLNIYFPMLNNILIKNGHLYVVLEDDEGEVSIINYKISLPQK